MINELKIIAILLLLISLTGCIPDGLTEEANQKFGDQHFKTVISLVEMHKLREGEYPSTIDSLKYLGEWDELAISSVEYNKLEEGYELNLINGWIGTPKKLTYPDDFWNGLGLVKSNLKK